MLWMWTVEGTNYKTDKVTLMISFKVYQHTAMDQLILYYIFIPLLLDLQNNVSHYVHIWQLWTDSIKLLEGPVSLFPT